MDKDLKYTVLLVDDNNEYLNLLYYQLQDYFEITLAYNGIEAIERCQNIKIDLILLDIGLPDISGYEVVSVLKKNEYTQEIPIIFLTGKYVEPLDILRGFEVNVNDYLIKDESINKVLVERMMIQINSKLKVNSLKKKNIELEELRVKLESTNIKLIEFEKKEEHTFIISKEEKNIDKERGIWYDNLANDKIGITIENIKTYLEKKPSDLDIYRAIIIISARFKNLKLQKILGTKIQEDLLSERNRIINSLLELIEMI